MRPTVPSTLVQRDMARMHQWAQGLLLKLGMDIKHTQQWGCEICGTTSSRSLRPGSQLVLQVNLAGKRAIVSFRGSIYLSLVWLSMCGLDYVNT